MPSTSSAAASSQQPTPAELIERAKGLTDTIREWSEHSNQQRDLAPQIVQAIHDAELFKIYQPKQWGGFEGDPRTLYAIQNIFAEHCASTAWVYGVLSVQSFLLGMFDSKAQADVWQDNDRTLASSSFMPVGKVERADGGYTISGRWSFSSGSSHAQWVLLGGLVPPAAEGQPPEMRLFLVPRSDYRTEDTWHTIGLCGTGSNDIVVERAFVPAYRTLQPDPGMVPVANASERAPLYRLPWLYIFTSSVANLGIGTTRGALRDFLAIERKRVSSLSGKAAKEDPAVQRVATRAYNETGQAELMFNQHLSRLTDSVNGGEPVTMQEALLLRSQLTGALRKLASLVDEMQLLLGGRGIYTKSPLTRAWLDMSAARAHPGNDPTAVEAGAGQQLLLAD